MRWRRWLCGVLALVGGAFAAKHFLLDTAQAATAEFVIDLGGLHRAAIASGPLPERIEVEKIGEFAFPRTIVVAGDGFAMHPMVLLAHRVVWPDRSLIIDTAMSPSAGGKLPRNKLEPVAFERLQKAMSRAFAIVFSHEHEDHVGGVAAAPNASAILGRVRMTTEQLESKSLERDDFAEGLLEKLAPLEYSGLYAVAPGVVLQKAPGHTPGSQLIYVELADGKRFVFVGDIAWTKDNIRLQRGRPGLAGLLMKEDRAEVAAQVKALARLPADVHLVVAHDPVALQQDLKAGLYRLGFTGL